MFWHNIKGNAEKMEFGWWRRGRSVIIEAFHDSTRERHRHSLYTWQRSKILGVNGLIITEHKDKNADKERKGTLKHTKKTATEGHHLLFPPSNASEMEPKGFKGGKVTDSKKEIWKITANAAAFSSF